MSETWEYAKSMSLVIPGGLKALADKTLAEARQVLADAEEELALAEEELAEAEETGVGLEAAYEEVVAAETALAEAAEAVAAAAEAATEAALALAAAALALEAGIIIGQILDFGLSALWDPVKPLYFFDRGAGFTSVNDLEIDTFILSQPMNLAFPHRILAADQRFPQLGTLVLSLLRCGIRTFVDAAQGNAASIAGDKTNFDLARAALDQDLKEYSRLHVELADCLDHYPRVRSRLPRFTLSNLQLMIDLASIKRLPRLIDYEATLIQQLFTLARVRCPTDIRPDLYAWIAQGMTPMEAKAFQDAPYQTLRLSDILRLHSRTLLTVNLANSPLIL